MRTRRTKPNPQSGQTLVEVITALFILTMATVAGLSLAIYSSNQNTFNRDRVIATNLAREGVEAVRVLRDSNWLAAEDDASVDDLYTANGGCTYSSNAAENRPCYPEAFNAPYDLEDIGTTDDYRLLPTTSNPAGWELDRRNGQESYGLCLTSSGTYQPDGNGAQSCPAGSVRFARRVVVELHNQTYPYTPPLSNPTATGGAGFYGGHSPMKIVRSFVVWEGRGCTPFPSNLSTLDPRAFVTRCKYQAREDLSNWKDYL